MSDPVRTCEFWRGPLEAATYLEAVRLNPRREDEGAFSYIARLSAIVAADSGQLETSLWEARQSGMRHYEEPL